MGPDKGVDSVPDAEGQGAGTDPGKAPHFVYFIRAVMPDGLIKIGRAIDPNVRFAELRTMSPVPLKPLGVVSSDRFAEVELHRRFQGLRSHGEWFDADVSLLTFIAENADPWPGSVPRMAMLDSSKMKFVRKTGPLRIVNGEAKRQRIVTSFIKRQGKWVQYGSHEE